MNIQLKPREVEAFKRHLKTLGLPSVEAYRAWCREQGFDPAVKKHWRERRQEQLAARRLAEKDDDEKALHDHLSALGMKSLTEYQTWCRANGFSGKRYKTPSQRVQERRMFGQLRRQAEQAGKLKHTRQTGAIERLYAGEPGESDLAHPYLHIIHLHFQALREAGRTDIAESYLALLRVAEERANLFSEAPVMPYIGPEAGNTYVDALYALATHHADWLHPADTWQPDTYEPRQQFTALARHLLARYEVPAFMDAAWFRGVSPEAQQQQHWFKHIGTGGNIRTADIPVRLSKRQAHQFLSAPDDFPIEWALRWGQLLGMGGWEELVHAVIATRLGEHLKHDDFWVSVFHFFINNPMLDTAYVAPVVDYIYNQRFEAPDVVQPDGTVIPGPIPQPDFTMKGRTVDSMLELVEAWHGELAKFKKVEDKTVQAWNRAAHIGEFEYTDEQAAVRWTIEELLDEPALAEEGKRMRHCVRSYTRSCVKGEVSIWSVKAENMKNNHRERVLTVAVKRDKSISQLRGHTNAHPDDAGNKRSKGGGAKRMYADIRRGRQILDMWIDREGLNVLKQT